MNLEYKVHIVQDLKDLPPPSFSSAWVLDTETSGLSCYHGHRIAGVALLPLVHKQPWLGFYLPVRHVEGLTGITSISSCCVSSGSGGAHFKNLDGAAVFAWLRAACGDPQRTWVMHNAVFDLTMLRADGVEVAGPVLDTGVFAHDIRGDLGNYSLDKLTEFALGKNTFPHHYYHEVEACLKKQPGVKTALGKPAKDYSRLPIDLTAHYAVEDVVATALLHDALQQKALRPAEPYLGAPTHGQRELLSQDMALVRVLSEMNWAGVRMDRQRIEAARYDALMEAEHCRHELSAMAGRPLNPRSRKELEAAFLRAGGEVKFWALPKAARGKQKAAQYTTDVKLSNGKGCWNASALLEYLMLYGKEPNKPAFRFLVLYRRYSQLTKLASTYLDAYLKRTDARGFMHGNFLPWGTRTGRLSSASPNMQNVTKPEGNADMKAIEALVLSILGENDDEAGDAAGGEEAGAEAEGEPVVLGTLDVLSVLDEYLLADYYRKGTFQPAERAQVPQNLSKRIRSFFQARPGHWLVAIDYNSVEYRVAAYLTGDPALRGAYIKDPKLDYHQYCADLLGITRGLAKTVNFGTLYGMGARGLASVLTASGKPTTVDEAKELIRKLYEKVPGMLTLQKAAERQLNTRIPGTINQNRNYVQNSFGRICRVPDDRRYVAVNYWVQGTCGDIMRAALIRVATLIRRMGWPILILLTVHDEIVFDVPEELVAEAAPALAACMCDVPEIGLPLLADVEVGRNWGEMVALTDWHPN